MRSEKHVLKKKVNKKRLIESLLGIFAILAIILGGVTGYYGSKVVSFLDGISTDEAGETPEAIEITKQEDPQITGTYKIDINIKDYNI